MRYCIKKIKREKTESREFRDKTRPVDLKDDFRRCIEQMISDSGEISLEYKEIVTK